MASQTQLVLDRIQGITNRTTAEQEFINVFAELRSRRTYCGSFFFFFWKISTRIHAMAYDEGAHPREVSRLDGSTPEPHQLLSVLSN